MKKININFLSLKKFWLLERSILLCLQVHMIIQTILEIIPNINYRKNIIIPIVLIFVVSQPVYSIEKPRLHVFTSGVNVSLSWSSTSNATGYKLYYAPYPYEGEQTINSIDMDIATEFSAELWDGAAYYVAITSKEGITESEYSNIELIIININSGPIYECNYNNLDLCRTSYDCSVADGLWYNNFCNTNPNYQIGIPYIAADGLTVTLNDFEIIEKIGSYQYSIDYTLKNNTLDQAINEGTFKMYYAKESGGLPQYGFFNLLFPGDKIRRLYTFEELKEDPLSILGYHHDHFFSATPNEGSLIWKVEIP